MWLEQFRASWLKPVFMDMGPAGCPNAREGLEKKLAIDPAWRLVAIVPAERKDLIIHIQQIIYDKHMFIPVCQSTSPTGVGPRVKGDPFPIKGPFPLWFVYPMEDLELNE